MLRKVKKLGEYKMTMINAFRQLLVTRDRPAVGMWSVLNSFDATEGLAWCGFDWMNIDTEHAPVELQDVIHHLRILDGTPTVPMVRLVWNDPLLIKRYLDAGASTLMLPFVQNAEEAKQAVEQMHYPPRGVRGMAAIHRASRYGAIGDYVANASGSLFLIVQVETLEALDNLPEILAVDGVDAVFFGPGDLSASMGMPGQAGSKEVTDKIIDALSVVRRTEKFAGTLATTPEQAKAFIEADFDFVSVASDVNVLIRNSRQVASSYVS
tara:strand:- start:3693 stop:4493 length:801 start_codon:yes stop_codon:yes gene_type:complete